MKSLAMDLAEARTRQIPRMALRPFSDDDPLNMDDIVVEAPRMLRMEAMNDDEFWIACYFPNGEEVVFWAHAYHEKGKRKALLKVTLGDTPTEWIDIDEERRGGRAADPA